MAGLAVIACAAAAVVPFASAEGQSDRQPVVGKPKLDADGCAQIPKSLAPLSDWPRVTSAVAACFLTAKADEVDRTARTPS